MLPGPKQQVHRLHIAIRFLMRSGVAHGHACCPDLLHRYVMTSPMTDAPTRKFFEDKSFFGLSAATVIFFEQVQGPSFRDNVLCLISDLIMTRSLPQGTLPCLTTAGDLLMESKGRVASAPDGNGGIYR